MSNSMKIAKNLDTCGLRCPIPLLRAKQALKEMVIGELLEVLSTDPSAKGDFEAMLKHLPHKLVEYSHNVASAEGDSGPKVDRFIIRKG